MSKRCKHCDSPTDDDFSCLCDGAEIERLTPAQGLVDLLKAEDISVTLDAHGARLFWSNASELWEVITWKRGDFVTHYRGLDLAAAIETFRKLEGIA